jgi:hypothetical protein
MMKLMRLLNSLLSKNFDDCRHIACSIVTECDCIVFWSFKHIVNLRNQTGVKIVSALTRL